MNYPKKVTIGDITVRDGFQHEEKFIPTDAKVWLAEQQILCGFKHIEVTNFGNPRGMPQFKDADELLKRLRTSKKIKDLIDSVSITTVTIRERAVDRAIEAKKEGYGPDRILLMVSTSESHHMKNSLAARRVLTSSTEGMPSFPRALAFTSVAVLAFQ